MFEKRAKDEEKPLFAGSETDGITTEVVDCEVLSQENVTNNPELATWEINVHASE